MPAWSGAPRPLRAGSARAVRPWHPPTAASTSLLKEPGQLWFAPAWHLSGDHHVLVATTGPRAAMRFEQRHGPDGRPQPRYVGGANRLRHVSTVGGTAAGGPEPEWYDARPDREHAGSSRIGSGVGSRVWFAARPVGGTWCIYVSQLGPSGWQQPRVALRPDPAETDSRHVLLPCALRRQGLYHLWYVGIGDLGRRIHLAVSSDGIQWTRQGVVVDQGADGTCDSYSTDCPSVVRWGDHFLMAYGAGSSSSVAAAISRNGRIWRKLGPFLHRGPDGSATNQYAFYPALRWRTDGLLDCAFAGEDRAGEWSLMRTRPLDPEELLGSHPPLSVAAPDLLLWRGTSSQLRLEHVAITEDAHGVAPSFRREDGQVRQLRPSSGAVFALGDPPTTVLKLGRGREAVEREYDALRWLSDLLPVPRAGLLYVDGVTVLALPWLDGPTLVEAGVQSPGTFVGLLEQYVAHVARACRGTLVPASRCAPQWTLQDRPLLDSWFEAVVEVLRRGHPVRLTLDGVVVHDDLDRLLDALGRSLRRPARWVAVGTGDNNLRNVLCTPTGLVLVDAELTAMYDVDFTIAKLVGSVLKHTPWAATADVRVSDCAIDVRTNADGGQPVPFDLWWWREAVQDLPVDWRRVLALVTAELVFRVRSGTDAGTGLTLVVLVAQLWSGVA